MLDVCIALIILVGFFLDGLVFDRLFDSSGLDHPDAYRIYRASDADYIARLNARYDISVVFVIKACCIHTEVIRQRRDHLGLELFFGIGLLYIRTFDIRAVYDVIDLHFAAVYHLAARCLVALYASEEHVDRPYLKRIEEV